MGRRYVGHISIKEFRKKHTQKRHLRITDEAEDYINDGLDKMVRITKYKLARIYTSGCYYTVPKGHCSDRGAIEITRMKELRKV